MLMKFDTANTAALAPQLRSSEGDQVSVIFRSTSGSGLTVRNRPILATTDQDGDASYLRIEHDRERRNETQFVLNAQAGLVGIVAGWEDNRQTARVAKSGYVALLLASHGHNFTVRRTARRIQESLVTVECHSEVASTPGFNAGTLSAFGAETWAQAFTQLYQEAWSSPNATALEFVDQVYGQSVSYFGKTFTKSGVIRDKTNFANRWDYRSYALREDELSIVCGATKCTIDGVNDYFTYGSGISQTSSGIAKFSFDLDLRTLQISRENSSVLSRSGANPDGMIADWAQSMRNCNAGNDIACGRADYLEIVMDAFDYCVATSRPSGRVYEVAACR
jgi:hypothetical protein